MVQDSPGDEGTADRQWRACLRQHGPALLLFARQWSATRAEAEDALQSGFLRFWKTRSRAHDELAYLYACVRSAAMDLGRSQRRRAAHEFARAGQTEERIFESQAESAERRELIEAALNQLPADQREVIVMKIWGGLTFAQISQAVDVSPNTVASRYRYALARLQAELEEVSRD